MNEFTAPDAVTVADDDNVAAALLDNARTHPDRPALAYRRGSQFVDVSTEAFVATVRDLAKGLIGLGVQPGDRVCIFMPSRIEFTYLDYAIWFAGATTVTVYETSSPEQIEWIVGNSEATVLVTSTAELENRYKSVADRLPDCRHVFVVDEDGLDDLRAHGADVDDAALQQRIDGITHDQLATLVYTSGTTGRPKGCMVTHGNLIWEVRQVVHKMDTLFHPGGSTLMFLPLAHILARVVQVGCVTQGVKIGYSTGVARLVPELEMLKPNWVFAVPRVFEKVFNTAQGKSGSGLRRRLFDHAVDVAIAYSKATIAGRVSPTLKVQRAALDKLVYAKLRSALGGNLEFALSGGAPLGERLGHFFHGAGVLVLEGYGLTETTAAATINTPLEFVIGSVGRPVPGASVKIADDGEILLSGGMVFDGYWQNEAATNDSFNDGWFATGDIGEIDADGYVSITGRKKELIVTAAGKNVAPAVLEEAIRSHPLVSQALVIGDQRPFIAAIVTLDVEELTKWAESVGAQASGAGELTRELLDDDRQTLRSEVQVAIDDANAHVSRAESIREFRILSRDFTIAEGELTPTLKLRRQIVLERNITVVESIYGD